MRRQGGRMKSGLSQEEERVPDAATNQVDSQPNHSGRPSTVTIRRPLSEVLRGVETTPALAASALEIRQVACDSRKVRPGALFFGLRGTEADGNAFIQDAIKRGAVAIASEEPAPGTIPAGVAWIQVREARKALAIAAANFFGHPAKALELVAVTGTNGKTTTTSLVDAIVKASGAKKQLFEGTGAGAPEVAVVNTDDEFGKRLSGLAKKTVTYGLESDADIAAKKFQLTFEGLTFTAHSPNGKVRVVSPLVGRINVYNLLAAIGAAQALGFSNEIIENGIRNLESVSGRFQRIDLGQPFVVIVDYA